MVIIVFLLIRAGAAGLNGRRLRMGLSFNISGIVT